MAIVNDLLATQEMKRCTPEMHPETELLDRTLPVIEEVAAYLNRNITEHELQRKFLELCEQGAQDLVVPHRALCYEGLLNEQREKRKVFLWVFNDISA